MTPMLTLNHQKLIRYLDTSIRKQYYGSLTLTVVIKDGVPQVDTARLVKMKRKKYKKHKKT